MSAVMSKSAKGTKAGGVSSKSDSSSSPLGGGVTPAAAQRTPAFALGQGATPALPLFGGGGLQTKPSVSAPDDPFEREADGVADAVNSGSPAPRISRLPAGKVQRADAAQEEEEERPEEAEEGGGLLQRAADDEPEETPEEVEEPPEEHETEETPEELTPVQTKVAVGQAGDAYEREADSVAQNVVSGRPASAISAVSPGGPAGTAQPLTQRQPADEEQEPAAEPEPTAEEEERPEEELAQASFIQRQAGGESCGCDGPCSCGAAAAAGEQEGAGRPTQAVVQASADGGGGGGDSSSGSVSHALHQRGAGSPLEPGVRQAIESNTGYDMSGVHVHQDNSAQTAARSLRARAFTHGSDIWLGPGESASDLRLMAHEATHVVQQNSGTGDIQRIQRKPSDYQHAEDGGAVGGRLNQRFDDIDESERPDEEPEVDRSELRQESSGLRGATRPDVDRPAAEQPKVEQSAATVEREAESPPDPLVEGEATQEPGGAAGGGEATGAAEQAAALAAQAMSAADSQTEPAAQVEVQPPEPVEPVDSAGEPLEADPEAEGAIAGLVDRAQFMREQGTLMRAQATEGRSNAEITRANLARVAGEIGQAQEGITTSQDHAAYRHEVVGQAEQALGVSQEKQARVAAEAPEYTAKADEGKEETGPMSSEAGDLASENNSNIPEDEDAADDAREQGAQINQVGEQSVTMDSAVSQTRSRAESLGQDAARAAELNTQTQSTIGDSQQQLDQLDARLTEHSSQAAAARAQVEGMASQPEALHAQASQLDEQGQALIASSFELESRLHATQQRYAAGTAAVPAVEEWDGELPAGETGAEGGEEGAIQLTPDETEPTPDTPAAAPETAAPPPPAAAATTAPTTPAATPAPSPAAVPSATGAAPAVPESDVATAVEPGAEVEEPTADGEAEEPAEAEGELAAEGEGEASAEAAPAAEDASGAAEEALPELSEELEPRQREPIDLNRELPPWLTGIEPGSEERREAAAQEQEDQRRAELAQINEWARGRPISELNGGERIGLALRVVGNRYYNMVSNISWPGWGGLARALVDPRTMLTGAVGGLNMILNAGGNLFSAERWREDPLGNLLQSSADIATGLTIILGSITALAGLVAAVMGALILVTFGFAAPVALPVIGVCTTIITTVGGWTIAVGKIALVLQALALIKNLIDAATAQTAEDVQREAGQIQANVNGALTAGMSILGARGAQAGLGRLRGRVAGVIRGSRRAGGARALARQTFGRGTAAVGRGAAAVGRGVVGGVRAVGRGAATVGRGVAGGARALGRGVVRGGRAVGRGAAAVGRGIVRGGRAVGRGAAAAGRGVRRGLRGVRRRLGRPRRRRGRRFLGEIPIPGTSHKLRFIQIGGRVTLWICSVCQQMTRAIDDVLAGILRRGPIQIVGRVQKRLNRLRQNIERMQRAIDSGKLTPAQQAARAQQIAAQWRNLVKKYGTEIFGDDDFIRMVGRRRVRTPTANGEITETLLANMIAGGRVNRTTVVQFLSALRRGMAPRAHGAAGIKILSPPVGDFTHELKIMGSGDRLLGRQVGDWIVFSEFLRGGLH